MTRVVRIATRRSPLALAQTRWVARELTRQHPGLVVEEVQIVTEGDRSLEVSLSAVGGKGLFVSEVEAAVQRGEADVAVHSLKDVPAVLGDGLTLLAVPLREDARDALVTVDGSELDGLEAGSAIGTSSVRRTGQLRARRPDLHYALIRGNVDTRLGKLAKGDYRAIVLACAGLKRLGLWDARSAVALDTELSVPAVGQGALAIEGRQDDVDMAQLIGVLEDRNTRLAIEAERSMMLTLGGGCHAPMAAYARMARDGSGRMRIDGWVGAMDGEDAVRAMVDQAAPRGGDAQLEWARQIGRELGLRLRESGADRLLHASRTQDTIES